MGTEKTAGRTESKARKIASRCDGTAEGTDLLLRALIQDRLNGAIGGKVTRDCCRAIGTRVQVARNADVLNDLHARSKELADDIESDLEEDREAARLLALQQEARELEARAEEIRSKLRENARSVAVAGPAS